MPTVNGHPCVGSTDPNQEGLSSTQYSKTNTKRDHYVTIEFSFSSIICATNVTQVSIYKKYQFYAIGINYYDKVMTF